MKELLAKLLDFLITALFDFIQYLNDWATYIIVWFFDLILSGIGSAVQGAINACGLDVAVAPVADHIGAGAAALATTFPELVTTWDLTRNAFMCCFVWYGVRWVIKLIPTIDG